MDIIQRLDNPPHHIGHRDRLRARFLSAPDAMPDYELLELLLFLAIPRRDTKPLAKTLIARFGSLSGVLNAKHEDLTAIDGVSDNIAAALKIIRESGLRTMKQDLGKSPILSSWDRLLDYLHAAMAHEQIEQFRILFLNKKNMLIADEVQQRGTVDHTPAYPREIIKRALELNATAIILVHNHPSGDAKPSQADIDLTKQVCIAAQSIGIVVHDHLIVTKTNTASFKSLGLL